MADEDAKEKEKRMEEELSSLLKDLNLNIRRNPAAVSAKLDTAFMNKCEDDFDKFCDEFTTMKGQAASKRDRETAEDPVYKSADYTYTEIEFKTIAVVIEKIRKVYGVPNVACSGLSGVLQHKGGFFYDLGSGQGKTVIAASLLHEFDSCIGIEYLGSLVVAASDVERSYQTTKKQVSQIIADRDFDTHISMLFGDFMDFSTCKDWTNGDVVFVNSTSFVDATMEKIAELAAGMRRGSFVVTMSKRLPSPLFTLLDYGMYPVSFGQATVYIQQKMVNGRKLDESDSDDDD